MAYTTIDDPSQHFDILTRSGVYDSSGTYDLTGLNFQPDFVWEKVRSVSGDHYLQNSSLTGKKMLKSNSSAAENTDGNIESYLSNGIQINRQYDWNSSRTLVDWFWKANGGTTTTNDASATSVGTIDSVYQANTTAGFSVVTYTGTGSAGTIAHGLGATPHWVLVKNRSTSDRQWYNQHIGNSSASKGQALNTTGAEQTLSAVFGDTRASSTVFTVGDNNSINTNGDNYVAYIFAPIKGYSKFGSFTGNNSSDGVFVYTGFKPRWVMAKNISTTHDNHSWIIFDSARETNNVIDTFLEADTNAADVTSGRNEVDFLSNGFKARESYGDFNGGTDTFIYIAFAEHPFVSSKGVPVTAR
jgi:hypothetical protein